MAKKRGKKNERSPIASPFITIALLIVLALVVIAFAVEGNDLFPSTSSPAPSQSFVQSPAITPGQTPVVSPDAQIPQGEQGLQIHFLEVGKADCILVLCDGKTMIVDGGDASDRDYIFSYLDNLGITSFDYMINTHPHADHLGALDQILVKYKTQKAYISPKTHTTKLYESFLLSLEETNVLVDVPVAGDSFMLGGAQITFYSPQSGADFGDEINDWSLVFMLSYGENRFLFTGDVESTAENALLESGFDLSCDVLKVAHHGSNTSSKKKMIEAASPRYAVITCDKTTEKGRPSDKVLSRLEEAGAILLRTDELGAIVVQADENSFELKKAA